jgi:aspartyl/asparaginyl beta-hydroxylase (cupin superfamily)
MQSGECWEINNSRPHLVENNSDIDRIHLLIDIMPNEELRK